MSSKWSGMLLVILLRFAFIIAEADLTGNLNCETPWIERNETRTCYLIKNDTMDFGGAVEFCHNMSASLVSIPDANTSNYLSMIIQQMSFVPNTDFWIGLHHCNETSPTYNLSTRRSGWVWLDGSNYSPTWNMWMEDKPSGNNSKCARLNPDRSFWVDSECSTLLPYICQQTVIENEVVQKPFNSMANIISSINSSSEITPGSLSSATESHSLGASADSFLITTEEMKTSSKYLFPAAVTSGSGYSSKSEHSLPVFTSALDLQDTSQFFTADNSTTGNASESVSEPSESESMLAIYLGTFVGTAAVVITVVTIIACVLCKRSRKQSQFVAFNLPRTQTNESVNVYDSLDVVISSTDESNSNYSLEQRPFNRSHNRPLPPDPSSRLLMIQVDDYHQLNDQLLSLKRPLENYINNEEYLENSRSTFIIRLINNASGKLLDMLWKFSGENRHIQLYVTQVLCTFSSDVSCSPVFVVESLVSLRLKITSLLKIYPTVRDLQIQDICYISLKNVNALLEMGIESLSEQRTANADYDDVYDVLFETNPLFQKLLSLLIAMIFRLETYSDIGTTNELDETWKSELRGILSETESTIKDVFSNIINSSEIPDPNETAEVEGERFSDILRSKLEDFKRSMDPIMPEFRQFLGSINSHVSINIVSLLEEVLSLMSSIISPRHGSLSSIQDSDIIYQNVAPSQCSDHNHNNSHVYHNVPNRSLVDSYENHFNLQSNRVEDEVYGSGFYEESPASLAPGQMILEDSQSIISYEEDCFEVIVDRTSSSWIEQTFEFYLTTPVDQLKKSIKVSFVGEMGYDGGALSREFFFMIFNCLISGSFLAHSVFIGSRGHLLPSIDHVLTDDKAYWFLGVLTAQAVNRGCRGVPGLSNALRHFLYAGAKISGIGTSLEMVTSEDLADLELRNVIDKILNDEPLLDEEKEVFVKWSSDSNFCKVLNSSTEKEAVQRIFRYYVFDSRMTQIQAIMEGIDDIGIRDRNSLEMDQLFPKEEKLTYEYFMSGIQMEPKDQVQLKAQSYFKKFCQLLYKDKVKNLSLEDLLHFFTGAPYFVSMVATQARFAEPLEKYSLPTAHACASELILPTVHMEYDKFHAAMVKGLELSGFGFGLV